MDNATSGFPVLHCLLEFAQIHAHIESVMLSNHFLLCCPLLLLPSVFPSIRVFSSESTLHQVAKVLELQLQHQSFQWIFRVDFLWNWLVWSPCCPGESQESSPAPQFESISSWHSAFFIVQLSLYWKTRSFHCLKVMSLFFNTLSGFVMAFLARSKCLLISWLQSLSSVILEPKKIRSVTGSTFPSSICHKVMEPDAIILAFWMLMKVKEESEKSVLKLKAGHSYYI